MLVGWFIACGVGVTALFNWLSNGHRPLWSGAASGLIGVAGVLGLGYCERRGWVKGFLWSRQQTEKRQRELAAAREKIIADARAKHRA